MKLTEYQSFKEKDNFFLRKVINTPQEFDNMISEIELDNNRSNLVFRGVNEAKYKTYTSAQRYWLTNELYRSTKDFTEFIKCMINNAKTYNNKLLERYFKAFGIQINDLLILSFLQHYGAPSPLLDITYSLFKALFFSFDRQSYVPTDNEINNYVSLYVYNIGFNSSENRILSIERLIPEVCKGTDKLIKDIKSKQKDVCMDPKDIEDAIKSYKYDIFQEAEFIYVDGTRTSKQKYRIKSIPNFLARFYSNNRNLIAQDGAFFLYSNDKIPLDDFMIKNQMYKFDSVKCYDIHKSLGMYIEENYFKTRGISHSTMYPQEEDIAINAYTSFLKWGLIV